LWNREDFLSDWIRPLFYIRQGFAEKTRCSLYGHFASEEDKGCITLTSEQSDWHLLFGGAQLAAHRFQGPVLPVPLHKVRPETRRLPLQGLVHRRRIRRRSQICFHRRLLRSGVNVIKLVLFPPDAPANCTVFAIC
jgi:hypothetical protein